MTLLQLAFNNVKRNIHAYIAYSLSCVFSVFIFFSFALSLYHPLLFNSYETGSSVFTALLLSEIIIFSFTFFFVLYSLNTFLKVRKKEFGILTILGMDKKDFNKLIFIENMVIGYSSIITGIIIGLASSKLFLMFTSKFLGVQNLEFYFPLKAIILTVISFSIIFILISFIVPKLINAEKTVELLKAGKKASKAPKSSIILALMSILMIGAGYYIGLSGDKYEQSFVPYLMTGLVLVGTLLLFSQFSVFALNLLKRNRNIYLSKTNLLWISNLSYKVKDNSRMLFLVCIASTVTFISIGLLYSMKTNQISTTKVHFPFPFIYVSMEGNKDELKHTLRIEELLESEGFHYKKYNMDYVKDTMNEQKDFYMIKQSDFNKVGINIDTKSLNLNKGEVALVNSSMKKQDWEKIKQQYSKIHLNKNNLEFKVVDIVDKNIVPQGVLDTLMVIDDQTFSKLKGDKEKLYLYDTERWTDTGDIATTLKDEFQHKYKDPFIFLTGGDMYEVEQQQSNILLYIAFFIGLIFFIGAGSFLYFRFYSDLDEEREKYKGISKLGLSNEELKKITTIEIASLFFIPYIVAAIHSSVAIQMLKTSSQDVIGSKSTLVLIAFFLVQGIYFLGVRQRFTKHLIEYIK
ncbi:ABC transporter permease protein [Gottschalkia acidurici 9a]|uniref:ABC transporter permease protein n=1 Tax=Gottschalkia acidurici (strain ATCC 7906 / DSM 604 / BCRC 14475 / CIP 104303 / KCTC 5404 / NCIMB 10678 / 9a) TaxID=1128398 RepID=K0AYQ6_GOTA9|nr:FtsX-like permease family protein [Gottschalkia acidurici]AFS78898.1 ABC transporter permease protein [Gottschalkia acidurici 9a]